MIDLSELPDSLATKLKRVREKITELRTPYREDMEAVDAVTGRRFAIARTVTPIVELSIRMPEQKVAQFIAERIRPDEDPAVIAEVSGEEFDAVHEQCNKLQVSWEHYYRKVAVDP